MITLVRIDPGNKDFIGLVKFLDDELAVRDGDDHPFYARFNRIDKIKYAIVVYIEGKPVGCGALKEYNANTAEIKRMFTLTECRGKGIATKILSELEMWAAELSYKKCILETGKRQPEAIALYKKNGYKIIPNYGQYAEAENSVCFEKEIDSI